MEKRKLILLDDEEAMLRSLERRFKYDGEEYELTTFTDVKSALMELDKGDCYAFITDIQMPTLTGDQVVGYIQQKYPEQICLVITGHADKEAIQRIVQTGNVAAILLKPLDFDKLKDALDNLAAED